VIRLVAVADTHLFHGDLTIPDGDVFVHAGDLCRGGTLDELRAAAGWLAALPHAHKVVVAGNHDWALAREAAAARAILADAGVTYLEDKGAVIMGHRFWGSPWQPAFHDWAFNLPRGAPLAARWGLIPPGLDVLVTHVPPAGIGDLGGEGIPGREGCADLMRRVDQVRPRLHLFGHIHQDGGLWQRGGTVFANVTTWECERAPTVIDLDADRVTPIAVPASGADRFG
jgi:predicted phosphohydrolase